MALKYAVNNSLSAITSLPSGISGGALNLISTQTASSSASLEFSMDGTYDSYVFKWININNSTTAGNFTFQVSTNGGSSYATTVTSTFFRAYHNEAGTDSTLQYDTNDDRTQSTSFQPINYIRTGDNENGVGFMTLYNPSSTTFVKHFIAESNDDGTYAVHRFIAGYFNTTSAIDSIQFKMESGNITSGTIKMYGVA